MSTLRNSSPRRNASATAGRGSTIHRRSPQTCGWRWRWPHSRRRRDRHPRRRCAWPSRCGHRFGVHRSLHPRATATATGVRGGVRRAAAGPASRRDRPVGGRPDPHAAHRGVRGRPPVDVEVLIGADGPERDSGSPNGWATACSRQRSPIPLQPVDSRPSCSSARFSPTVKTSAAHVSWLPQATIWPSYFTPCTNGQGPKPSAVCRAGRSGRGRRPSATSSPTKVTWCG